MKLSQQDATVTFQVVGRSGSAGRVKTRLEGALFTAPDPKRAENILTALDIQPKEKSPVPSRKLNLDEDEPLTDDWAKRCRSAVGSGMYLSAVKELARHMAL